MGGLIVCLSRFPYSPPLIGVVGIAGKYRCSRFSAFRESRESRVMSCFSRLYTRALWGLALKSMATSTRMRAHASWGMEVRICQQLI